MNLAGCRIEVQLRPLIQVMPIVYLIFIINIDVLFYVFNELFNLNLRLQDLILMMAMLICSFVRSLFALSVPMMVTLLVILHSIIICSKIF